MEVNTCETVPLHLRNNQNNLLRRSPQQRVFSNRNLALEKIKFFGFDMDYTLACYKSPEYEQLTFDLVKERLHHIGYPDQVKEFAYDHTFPIRGLWFDKLFGNLIKMDQYGNILMVIHGFSFLSPTEIRKFYPNKFLTLDESRCFILSTLFNLPEIYMLACLVRLFDNQENAVRTDKGVKIDSIFMSYKSIYQDVRSAVDYVHSDGSLKCHTTANLERYVHRDARLGQLLNYLSHSKNYTARVFLLTNSDYAYTNLIMKFMLEDGTDTCKSWRDYFDYIFVDACKPLFFSEGTLLRRVDTLTGQLHLGSHIGPLNSQQIYSGGSCEAISKLIGARGKDVLYIGDHIHGDILKSKKMVGWRTFLVIPELNEELYVWKNAQPLYEDLERLDEELRACYRHLGLGSDERPQLGDLRSSIRNVVKQLDQSHGVLGSLFRCGSRQTFFSGQVMRYADLYAHSCLNLLYYPRTYMFRSVAIFMPHEATVSTNTALAEDDREAQELAAAEEQLSCTELLRGSLMAHRSQRSDSVVHGSDFDKSMENAPKNVTQVASSTKNSTILLDDATIAALCIFQPPDISDSEVDEEQRSSGVSNSSSAS